MEPFDKLIPLFALVGIGVFLLFLLRLARGERAAQAETPPPIAAPVVVPVAKPIVAGVGKKGKTAPSAVALAAAPVMQTNSPIDGVLELLKNPDSMATAFLLREILGPPVSRRR